MRAITREELISEINNIKKRINEDIKKQDLFSVGYCVCQLERKVYELGMYDAKEELEKL